jgi:hypothetical protein
LARFALFSVLLSMLVVRLVAGGGLPAAVAADSDRSASLTVAPLPLGGSVAVNATPPLWWGNLNVARGGVDLVTTTITPQFELTGPGFGMPFNVEWVVLGTCTRIGSPQPGFMAGTIAADGTTTLRFYGLPEPPLAQQQVAVGVTTLGADGLLHGTVKVVQGPDLNDTFAFDLAQS